ncbi:VWA domain-containing protein [Verrucomicrobium sp. BvORR106]|uniref:vWA domain-containing protein n=1 Tax=Verrucomicrobium sp. BvORR106 TaxID=1403819 RepID=UPI000689E6C0|nr:VWA domain-containing protein [Verrucomicrobium sp. BvORR106]
MNFGAPSFAYLLFLLPLLALLKIVADANGLKAIQAFATSERLRNQLLGGASRMWSSLHFGLQLLGLGFFVIALTRPQYGLETRVDERTGRNIFIAIDTSKSMLADDVSPNRLGRAKLAAQDLLEKLPNDRVGIIAFAGRAYLQAPLTNDHEAVVECIQSLDHTTIPRGGSSIASAIQLAVETVDKVKGREHGMVLFTDGQETDEATLTAARMAAQKGLIVVPVGLGTAEGALIPDPDEQSNGGYLRDEAGNVINTRLEAPLLQEVAKITGGEYVPLGTQALTQSLVARLLGQLERQKLDSQKDTRPIERYQWPLAMGIACICLSLMMRPSSRRRIKAAPLPVDPQATLHHPVTPSLPAMASTAAPTALLAGCLLLLGGSLHGATPMDLERARRAYESGRYEAARNSYQQLLADEKPPVSKEDLSYGLGASDFQLKDYDHSVKAFSDAAKSRNKGLQKQALRGLATALYNQGDLSLSKQPDYTVRAWTDSLNHFDTALDLDKDNVELKTNRDFVQARLDELKKQIEMQKQQPKPDKDKQNGKGKGEGEPKEGEGEGKPDEPQDGSSDQKKQTDAMEQKSGDLPEGELRAGESGKPDDKGQGEKQEPGDESKVNDKTGFSPQEARNQLRNYANDQQSVQYLQRREQPHGGKDY